LRQQIETKQPVQLIFKRTHEPPLFFTQRTHTHSEFTGENS